MTIAIVAHGTDAGFAIAEALAAAEAVANGAIGGFVSAAAIADGRVVRSQTQAGGVGTLEWPSDSERQQFGKSTLAGLISSGPNRPEPLAAFVAASESAGLVTGHRMPNARGIDGQPMNRSVLNLMEAGQPVEAAVERVLNDNPAADCGLIAASLSGEGYCANTDSVESLRGDLGCAVRHANGNHVWLLHNAIRPDQSLAELIADITLSRMTMNGDAVVSIQIDQSCAVRRADVERIEVDEDLHAVSLTVTGEIPVTNTAQPVNLGYRPDVYQRGKLLGRLMYEPFLLTAAGKVQSLDGYPSISVAMLKIDQPDQTS